MKVLFGGKKRFGVLFLFLLLAGCNNTNYDKSVENNRTIPVDPVLREYYQDLGGDDRLGMAISEPYHNGESVCQYAMNVLLCHNPLTTGKPRFSLQPLGEFLRTKESPKPFPDPEKGPLIDGYQIPYYFAEVYNEMGGAATVGKPITNAFQNLDKQQVEQYFENVGFYHRFDDPPGVVNLLPYGAMACDDRCLIDRVVSVLPENSTHIQTPFASGLDRIGGEEVFGEPLSQARDLGNGLVEQVYTNAIVYGPVENPSALRFKPITRQLGMFAVSPAPRDPTQTKVVFHVVDGDLGYHVPEIFEQFIALHGGMELSGQPIADTIFYRDEQIIRQCFESYCLDYYPDAEAAYQIRLAPLGKRFVEAPNGLEPTVATEPVKIERLVLEAGEVYPEVQNDQPQEIRAYVYDPDTGQPKVGIQTQLKIIMPDGSEFLYNLPLTGEDGWASIVIAPLPSLPNGIQIPYVVCIIPPETAENCVFQSYLIWNSQ